MSTSQQFQYFYTVFWLTCLVVFWQYSPWTSVFSKGKGVLFLFLHQNIIEFFIKKRIYYTCKKLDRQRQTGSLVLVNHPTNHIYCSLETLNHEVQQVTLRPPTVPPPSLSKCYKFMRMLKNNARWAQINFSPSADARTNSVHVSVHHTHHVHIGIMCIDAQRLSQYSLRPGMVCFLKRHIKQWTHRNTHPI